MMTLNATLWNEIQATLNKDNTECLEADIDSRRGSFLNVAEQFLRKFPSFKLDTVTSINGGLDAKNEEAIKEAFKVYATALRQKGGAAVNQFKGKSYATAKAEIKLDAHLSDYLTSADPATQLLLRMTNVFLTEKADLRYDAIENGEEWEFRNGRIERVKGITGMIQFIRLPK